MIYAKVINGGVDMTELVLGLIAAISVLNLIGNTIILAVIRGILEMED